MSGKKLPLSKISFINSIVTTLLLAVVFIAIGIYEYKKFYDTQMKELKSSFIQKNKLLIKEEVNALSLKIENRINQRYNTAYKIVEDRVSTAKNIFGSYLQKDLNVLYTMLKSMVFKTTPGYFFVFNDKGDVLFHQINEKLVGSNIFSDSKAPANVRSFIREAIEKGYVSRTYIRKKFKNNENITLHVNIQKLDDIPVYVAFSSSMDEVDKTLQQEFFKELQTDRFGYDSYGYFWINDVNDKMIFHPIQKELVGKINTDLKDKNGIAIFQKIREAIQANQEGYIQYLWEIPGTKTLKNKISYVKSVKYWDWIIGAGFYLEDFEKHMQSEQEKLDDFLTELVISTILFLLIVSAVILVLSWKISQRFKLIEEAQKRDFNLLEQYK
jgi:signal transduction histidine kinase